MKSLANKIIHSLEKLKGKLAVIALVALALLLVIVCIKYIANRTDTQTDAKAETQPNIRMLLTDNDIKLATDKSTVGPGEEITISYANIPKDVEATLFIDGYVSKFLWYKTEGTVKIKAPSTAGEYYAYIYINGDRENKVTKSGTITVTSNLEDKTVDDHLNVITRGYYTDFATFSLARKSNLVEGYYDHNNGVIKGTVNKDEINYEITGTFEETSSNGEKYKGDIIIYLSIDAEIARGSWRFKGNKTWQTLEGGWPTFENTGKQSIRINCGSDEVSLLWDEDFQDGVIGYNVYRKSEKQGWCQKPINQALIKDVKYVDTSVKAGQKYNYVVKAVFMGGKEEEVTKETSAYTGGLILLSGPNGTTIQGPKPVDAAVYSVIPFYHSYDNAVFGLADYYAEMTGVEYSFDSGKRKGVFSHAGTKVELQADDPVMLVNGRKVTLSIPPYVDKEDGTFRIPVKEVSNSLGFKVEQNEADDIFSVYF